MIRWPQGMNTVQDLVIPLSKSWVSLLKLTLGVENMPPCATYCRLFPEVDIASIPTVLPRLHYGAFKIQLLRFLPFEATCVRGHSELCYSESVATATEWLRMRILWPYGGKSHQAVTRERNSVVQASVIYTKYVIQWVYLNLNSFIYLDKLLTDPFGTLLSSNFLMGVSISK